MWNGIVNAGVIKFKVPTDIDATVPTPNGYRILIRMLDVAEEKTQSGLQIHFNDSDREELEESMTIGYVQALGDLCYTNKDFFTTGPWCKVGDYIMFSRSQGLNFEINKIRYKLLQDDRPVMTFSEKLLIDNGILIKE